MTLVSRKMIGLLFFLIMLMGILVATPFWAQTGAPKPGQKWEETPYLWAGKTLEELSPSVAKNILPRYGEQLNKAHVMVLQRFYVCGWKNALSHKLLVKNYRKRACFDGTNGPIILLDKMK